MIPYRSPFSFIYIMPELLKSLDSSSHIESVFAYLDFLSILFHLYRKLIFNSMKKDSLISLSKFNIDGYIPHNIYHIYYIYSYYFSYIIIHICRYIIYVPFSIVFNVQF